MDPITIAGLATAAGSVLGGAISSGGSAKANRANRQMNREQMAFQERTRANQYQVAMEDMRKAGLNPILAGKLGGAGSLSGASALSQNESEAVGEGVSKASSSASEAMRLKAEIDNIRATTEKTKADIFNNNRATDSLLMYQEDLAAQARANSALSAANEEQVRQNIGSNYTAPLKGVVHDYVKRFAGSAPRAENSILTAVKNVPGYVSSKWNALKAADQQRRRSYRKG